MRPIVQSVNVKDKYMLEICFDNGVSRIFDVAPYIKGDWFGMLEDPQYFKQVRPSGVTISWPDGQDICPDELYDSSLAV